MTNEKELDQAMGDTLKAAMKNVDNDIKDIYIQPAPPQHDFRPLSVRNALAPSGVSHATSMKETDDKAFNAIDKSLELLRKSRVELMSEVKKKMAELASMNHEIMVAENMLLSRQFAADMLEVSLGFSKAPDLK